MSVSVPELSLELKADSLVAMKPYPNKTYHVGMLKGRRALNGFLVKSPRTLAEFTMITLWEIDGFGEISHTVKTLVQDNDYDLVSHDVLLAHAYHQTEEGLGYRVHPSYDTWELSNKDGAVASVDVTGAVTTDDMSFVRKAVLAGSGIGILPTFLCARAEVMGKLVRVLDDWSLNGAVLHIAYPSARFVPQRVAVLRDYLIRALGKIGKVCDSKRAALIASPSSAQETTRYSYDALGHLVGVTHSGGAASGVTSTYSYDPAGNRTNVTTSVPVAGGDCTFAVRDGGFSHDWEFPSNPFLIWIDKSGSCTAATTLAYSFSRPGPLL
ncbi:DUF6012 family protein [Salmonella enterica]|nr:DUF6012 family protein [Salmonella enterica]